jgi:hypothetical protein
MPPLFRAVGVVAGVVLVDGAGKKALVLLVGGLPRLPLAMLGIGLGLGRPTLEDEHSSTGVGFSVYSVSLSKTAIRSSAGAASRLSVTWLTKAVMAAFVGVSFQDRRGSFTGRT